MTQQIGFAALSILPLWFGACGEVDRDSGPVPWTGQVTTVDGVTVVRNGGPMFDPEQTSTTEAWRTPEEGLPSAPEWGLPARIQYYYGNLYILDGLTKRVHTVSDDGIANGTFGREGPGPAEFLDPFRIAVIDNHIAVADRRKGSVATFDLQGNHETYMPDTGPLFALVPLADSLLLFRALGGQWTIRKAAGDRGRGFRFPETWAVNDSGTDCRRVTSAGHLIIESSCIRIHFRVIEPTGRVMREILGPDEPEELTSHDREILRRTIRSRLGEVQVSPAMAQAILSRTVERNRIKHRIQEVRWDDGHRVFAVWEQDPEDLGGGNAMIHLFSEYGVYIARFSFESSWKHFDIQDGIVYALEEDPTIGVVSVAAHALGVPWSQIPDPTAQPSS